MGHKHLKAKYLKRSLRINSQTLLSVMKSLTRISSSNNPKKFKEELLIISQLLLNKAQSMERSQRRMPTLESIVSHWILIYLINRYLLDHNLFLQRQIMYFRPAIHFKIKIIF